MSALINRIFTWQSVMKSIQSFYRITQELVFRKRIKLNDALMTAHTIISLWVIDKNVKNNKLQDKPLWYCTFNHSLSPIHLPQSFKPNHAINFKLFSFPFTYNPAKSPWRLNTFKPICLNPGI